MGILSASTTFVRYYVPDAFGKDGWERVASGLEQGRFREVTEGQVQSMGFACLEDLFSTDFSDNEYRQADYVLFHFRVDRRRIPPILFRQQLRTAIEAFKEENDGRRPPRHEKQRMRETVMLGLLEKVLPEPTGFHVVWNTRQRWLLATTRSKALLDTFWEHARTYLDIHPVPLYHAHWASRLVPDGSSEQSQLASLVSTKSPQALLEGRFLGYEFLTWLWCQSEKAEGRVRFTEGGGTEVFVGEKVILSDPEEGRDRVVSTSQTGSHDEARTALRRGKLVEELEMLIRVGDNEYTFRLDRDLWALKALRTPKQMREPDEDEFEGRFLEKMYFLEETFTNLDGLYRLFLSRRLTTGWRSRTWPDVKKWAETD